MITHQDAKLLSTLVAKMTKADWGRFVSAVEQKYASASAKITLDAEDVFKIIELETKL